MSYNLLLTGVGCRCRNGWRVIQDVGFYQRSTPSGSSGPTGQADSGLECEVETYIPVVI